MGIKEESKDNITEQYYTNKEVNLNKYFNIRETQLSIPQKTLKRYKNQYLDVEKSDNFKVLSYRQDEYESDINKPKNKSIKIQIFNEETIKEENQAIKEKEENNNINLDTNENNNIEKEDYILNEKIKEKERAKR